MENNKNNNWKRDTLRMRAVRDDTAESELYNKSASHNYNPSRVRYDSEFHGHNKRIKNKNVLSLIIIAIIILILSIILSVLKSDDNKSINTPSDGITKSTPDYNNDDELNVEDVPAIDTEMDNPENNETDSEKNNDSTDTNENEENIEPDNTEVAEDDDENQSNEHDGSSNSSENNSDDTRFDNDNEETDNEIDNNENINDNANSANDDEPSSEPSDHILTENHAPENTQDIPNEQVSGN